MKLYVVHDGDGRILAASGASDDPELVVPVPLAREGEGEFAAEIEVSGEYADQELYDLCTQFRVHPERGELIPLNEPRAT